MHQQQVLVGNWCPHVRMEEVEGHSLFLVIFLIVFVCALSCGLLWFICTKLLEDTFGDGFRQLNFIAHRKQIANAQMLGAPTKIIVTKPPKEIDDPEANANETEEAENHTPSFKDRLVALRARWRDSPDEKVIYSCAPTPVPSPMIQREFLWSKSKNYDYNFQSASTPQNSPTEKKSLHEVFLAKFKEQPESGPIKIECNTPISLFHHHPTVVRAVSAPSRPQTATKPPTAAQNHDETVLHM